MEIKKKQKKKHYFQNCIQISEITTNAYSNKKNSI